MKPTNHYKPTPIYQYLNTYIYIYVPYSILHTWMAMRPLRIIDTWMAMRPLRMIDLKYNFKMARWPLKCIGMPWQWYQWPWGLCCQHLLHGMQWSPTATFFLGHDLLLQWWLIGPSAGAFAQNHGKPYHCESLGRQCVNNMKNLIFLMNK